MVAFFLDSIASLHHPFLPVHDVDAGLWLPRDAAALQVEAALNVALGSAASLVEER